MNKNYQRSVSTSYYNTNYQYNFIHNKESDGDKMHGSRRVITFCLLTAVLPTILIVMPLYLRSIRYADVMYKISDSDVIQIHKGQSSIFCQKHSLRMNTSFNAFQMKGRPELSGQRKHIRLKKSMKLPDDTLEYWGFYLLKGATVELKGCSRYEGSKILVVKGDRILNTCGILDGYNKDPPIVENQGSVLVTLENPYEKKERNLISDLLINKQQIKEVPDENENNTFESGFNYDDKRNTSSKTRNGVNKISDKKRRKRDATPLHNPNTILDTGVHHGGNAHNTSSKPDSAVSSFEINLYECYNENILMNNYFPNSIQCNSTNYLEGTTTLKVIHEVLEDGYYYYIFYSENDFVKNGIHAIFDIFKPTFQYVNNSDAKMCVNKTECEFNVGFFSDELVIVEVPTKDGLTNDDEDSSILVSVCHPRMTIYIFFPISVLLLILLFSFL